MAKRGETRPWRVTYRWDSGIGGTEAYASEDQANYKADQIRQAAIRQDRDVTVSVTLKESK